MGVVSVTGVLTARHWTGAKPDDYTGTELDSALQAWEGLAGKQVQFDKNLMPALPDCKVGALGACSTKLKSVVTTLEQGKTMVGQWVSALKAVQAAGGKAAADLNKLAKGKDVDEAKQQKYQAAAGTANSIAGAAAGELKKYE